MLGISACGSTPQPTAMSSDRAIHLHRVFTCPPEKLWRAFTEPEALARWLPPNGFTATVHELDVRPGGRHRAHFTNFGTGTRIAFGGEYLEVQPPGRLRYTDRFDDPALPGEMVVTVTLEAVSVGTELRVQQAGIPESIPLEACVLGWQESLRHLARLVEPVIPG
jgi:uncharacterized protein YndB with AHSA1/START domain